MILGFVFFLYIGHLKETICDPLQYGTTSKETVLHISISKLTKPFLFQIVFFNTSEALMLPPGQKATSLYTLMLFNSTTYCLTYLYSLVTR